MNALMGQIEELNENFNELGEDLVLLESVAIAVQVGYPFPKEFVESGVTRVMDYIRQHLEDVRNLSGGLSRRAVKNSKAASSLPGGDRRQDG